MRTMEKIISGLFVCMMSASSQAVVIDFDTPTTNITYNGAAMQTNNYGRLTEPVNGQVGSMWYNTAFDTTSGFTVTFDMYAGSNTSGADGMTFAVIDTAMGLNAIGGGGGGLGYLGMAGNSVAWEFDTWFNSGFDPDGNHIGLDYNGAFNATASLSPFGITLEDNATHQMIVSYDNSTDTLSLNVDAAVIFSTVLGSSLMPETAYFGFTGATGGLNNLQYIDNWTITATPAAVPEPAILALMGLGLAGIGYRRKKAA